MNSLSIIGLMSGSSLDGLDITWCDFVFEENSPVLTKWAIRKGQTIPYSLDWQNRLRQAPQLSGKDLWQLHTDLGHLYGKQVMMFLEGMNERPDLIASHGHTVFHFPEQGSTTQIGDGAAIAAELGMVVIDQFRSLDVALGGQGAPLAPLVDQYLFSNYFACLNLGGIANMSVQTSKGYIAFDNGGANQILNALSQEIGLEYDRGGQLARKGKCIPKLLETVNTIEYFAKPYPKSLGNDWVQEVLLPYYQNKNLPLEDRLNTACRQIAQQVGKDFKKIIKNEHLAPSTDDKILVTGGGAFNTYLCELIAKEIEPMQLAKVETELIDYKEAILIALAGALRWLEQPNILPNVTGARRAAVGGAIHWGLSIK